MTWKQDTYKSKPHQAYHSKIAENPELLRENLIVNRGIGQSTLKKARQTLCFCVLAKNIEDEILKNNTIYNNSKTYQIKKNKIEDV